MSWLWTWDGECFGYRDGDDLRTHDGRHVGKFIGETVFDRRGVYLGEIKNGNRLIRRKGRSSTRGYSFTPWAKRAAYAKRANYVGYAMYSGFEDFPNPESFT